MSSENTKGASLNHHNVTHHGSGTTLAELGSESLVELVFRHRSKLFTLTILVAIIGAGYAGYSSYRSSQTEKAATALHEAEEKLAQSGAAPTAPNPTGSPASTTKNDAAWQDKAGPALQALEGVATTYKGTMASVEALLKVGDTYYGHGVYDKAAQAYQRAAEQSPNRFLKVLALYSWGYALENNKDHAGAIQAFQNALRQGEKTLKAEILVSLGRNFEATGDKAKALEQYNLVTTEFPNTPFAQVSEKQKARLK